jgi:hypothetical protein
MLHPRDWHTGNMGPDKLQEHILSTYFGLRIGIAAVGLQFPFILWGGGAFFAGLPLQNSMSAYYHQISNDGRSMRDYFVGLLFVVGISLYLYKGYSRLENYLLNIAGAFCVGVALFPMPWPEGSGTSLSFHYICAVIFFVCIGCVAIFCAGDTLPILEKDYPTRAKALKHLYRLVGAAMIIFPVLAYVLGVVTHYAQRTFFIELAGILSFGVYWAFKTAELRKTEAECKGGLKRLKKTNGKVEEI